MCGKALKKIVKVGAALVSPLGAAVAFGGEALLKGLKAPALPGIPETPSVDVATETAKAGLLQKRRRRLSAGRASTLLAGRNQLEPAEEQGRKRLLGA